MKDCNGDSLKTGDKVFLKQGCGSPDMWKITAFDDAGGADIQNLSDGSTLNRACLNLVKH